MVKLQKKVISNISNISQQKKNVCPLPQTRGFTLEFRGHAWPTTSYNFNGSLLGWMGQPLAQYYWRIQNFRMTNDTLVGSLARSLNPRVHSGTRSAWPATSSFQWVIIGMNGPTTGAIVIQNENNLLNYKKTRRKVGRTARSKKQHEERRWGGDVTLWEESEKTNATFRA